MYGQVKLRVVTQHLTERGCEYKWQPQHFVILKCGVRSDHISNESIIVTMAISLTKQLVCGRGCGKGGHMCKAANRWRLPAGTELILHISTSCSWSPL
jgi:hypothetical protein